MKRHESAVGRAAVALVVLVISSVGALARGDDGNGDATAERRTVVVGARYQKGGFYRWLFGAEYRDLWTAPVSLEVLDLSKYAGGLKPTRVLGHGQTKSLALVGADGRNYTFRPVLKDPTGLLPEDLQQTVARAVIVDQMASGHPAAHVVVPGLLEPAGVLHNEPHLVIMPDDPALGEFQERFANAVGDIEVWTGTPGFEGSLETIDGEEMWKRLRRSPDVRVDSRAYLKARLLDQLMGDWDRHRDQWRWFRMPGKDLWQPVPEDRDQAFVRFEGVVIALIRPQVPMVVDFSPEHSSQPGLTFDGWDVDKRILSDLEWPTWQEVAAELQSALSDEVIEAAAKRMPPEYFAKDGARLIAGLKGRRATLPEQARRFYRYINKDVDIFCTDQDERVTARRFENGDIEISVGLLAKDAAPYFRRRFEADVTHEVRLYLYAGADEVVVTGGHHGGVLLRVVAGGSPKRIDDSQGGGTRVSDPGGQAKVAEGPGSHIDTRTYQAPPPSKSAEWTPARDWGRTSGPLFLATYGSDYGLLIGGAWNTMGYGFRKDPWSDRQSFRLQYSTKERSVRGTYTGEFRFENSPFRIALFGLGSGIEVSRFFGKGNTTTFQGDQQDYTIDQDRFHVEPALVYGAGPNTDLSLGIVYKHNKTEPRANPILNASPEYGMGNFAQTGATLRFRYDGTHKQALPRNGAFLTAGAALYPKLADVEDTFGELHGQAKAFLSIPGDLGPTLALKLGGQKVWGRHPFFESAFIGGKSPFNPLEPGGGSSVRGLPPQRYAGDGSAFANADLYLPLTKAFLLVPGQIGLTGFFDVGRVFVNGETSDKWHNGYGGGLFFATPGRHSLVSFLYARSEGNTAYYLRAGLAF
jgi:hypothetical protein